MFCSNCGKQIPDGSKFCPYCGAPVMKIVSETSLKQAKEKPISIRHIKFNKKPSFIALIALDRKVG